MLPVLFAFSLIVYLLIERIAFRFHSRRYARVCRPIVFWSIASTAMCVAAAVLGIKLALVSADHRMIHSCYKLLFSIPGIGGNEIAGVGQMTAGTPFSHVYFRLASTLMVCGFVSVMVVASTGYLTIKGIAGIYRSDNKTLFSYYCAGSFVSAVNIGVMAGAIYELLEITGGVAGSHNVFTGVVCFLIALLCFYGYYHVFFGSAVKKVLKDYVLQSMIPEA